MLLKRELYRCQIAEKPHQFFLCFLDAKNQQHMLNQERGQQDEQEGMIDGQPRGHEDLNKKASLHEETTDPIQKKSSV